MERITSVRARRAMNGIAPVTIQTFTAAPFPYNMNQIARHCVLRATHRYVRDSPRLILVSDRLHCRDRCVAYERRTTGGADSFQFRDEHQQVLRE
jgi:hypothetical protein